MITRIERRFWEIITWFGALPGLCIPLIITGVLHLYSSPISLGLNASYTMKQESLMIIGVTLVGIGISYSIGLVVKYLHYKQRPIAWLTETRWQKISASSFPSIHSSNAMILGISWMIGVGGVGQLSIGTILIILIGFSFYLSIALSRIALDHHFPIDVLAGSVLGLTISLVLIIMVPVVEGFIL